MASLAQRDRSRIRFHLCYPEENGDPGFLAKQGDRVGLEKKMDSMSDQTIINYVRDRLDRCDRALSRSELLPEDIVVSTDSLGNEILMPQSNVATKQIIAGDVNRSTSQVNQPESRDRFRAYAQETNALARDLAVRNYRSNPLPFAYA